MPATFNYPAEIERGEDGRCVITFPDFGWGATDGATRDEALTDARDLLREPIADTIREGEALPEPSRPGKSRPLVIPPVQIALKAAFVRCLPPNRPFETPYCPRLGRHRKRGAAHVEPGARHQGGHYRRCTAPARQANSFDRQVSSRNSEVFCIKRIVGLSEAAPAFNDHRKMNISERSPTSP